MIHLLLLPFLPEIKETVTKVLLPSISGSGVSKKDVKELSKHLYAKIPQQVRIVNEDSFVEFCMKHQEKIFPQESPKKAGTKKAASKKATKTVSKKATRKK